MIEVQTTNKEVKILRAFEGIEAYEKEKKLTVTYIEQTVVGGEILKEETKSYVRDYDFWKQSQLGVALIAMIENDLLTGNIMDKPNQMPTTE
jgi:hypothetical protein